MRTWEKIALPSFAAAASDKKKKQQQHGKCMSSETWVLEMQNGITLGLKI